MKTESSINTTYTSGVAPGARLFIGHAGQLLRDPLAFLTTLPHYGDVVEIRLGPARITVVCHPDLVHQLLMNDRVFDKGGPLYVRLREVIGSGVGSCPRDAHRKQRRLMQPAFHASRLRGYADEMCRQITAQTDTWRDGEAIDVYRTMTSITSRIIARTLFSTPEAAAHTTAFAHAMNEMLGSMALRMLAPPSLDWAPLPGRRRFRRARAEMRQISEQIIDHYRRTGVEHHDVLSMLLAARDDHGKPLTDNEICDEITTLYLAGAETNAAAMSWACHLVAEHPQVQRRLHDEVDAALAGNAATWDDISRLRYTRQIIDESLRLYPPGWVLTRASTADAELGGCRIPAGTTIAFSPYLVHHQPGLYHDPERFDPDRWLGQPRPAIGTYTPFGGGARKCLGETFALTQTTLALATIASAWQLTPVSGNKPRRGIGTTLTPKKLRLHLHRRDVDN